MPLYEAPAAGLVVVVLVTVPVDEEPEGAAGLRWLVAVPVGLTAAGFLVTDVDLSFLLTDVLVGAVDTRAAVTLPLDVPDDVLTRLADDVVLLLLTLLVLDDPLLVETLLVNTRSEPVYLRFPSHLSLPCTGAAG